MVSTNRRISVCPKPISIYYLVNDAHTYKYNYIVVEVQVFFF